MTVDRREVERIAALARLHLPEEEVPRLVDEMNRILEHVDRLGTEGADVPPAPSPTAGPVGAEDDTSGEIRGTRTEGAIEPDALRRGVDTFAPRLEDGFLVVPPLPGVTPDGDTD